MVFACSWKVGWVQKKVLLWTRNQLLYPGSDPVMQERRCRLHICFKGTGPQQCCRIKGVRSGAPIERTLFGGRTHLRFTYRFDNRWLPLLQRKIVTRRSFYWFYRQLQDKKYSLSTSVKSLPVTNTWAGRFFWVEVCRWANSFYRTEHSTIVH